MPIIAGVTEEQPGVPVPVQVTRTGLLKSDADQDTRELLQLVLVELRAIRRGMELLTDEDLLAETNHGNDA